MLDPNIPRLPFEIEGAEGVDVEAAASRLLQPESPPEDHTEDKPQPDPDPEPDTEGDEPDPVEDEDSDEGDSEDDSPEDDDTEYVTVKVDGKEERVTLEEALKGYSRTQNYTRDKQKLAEERKAFEAEREATRQAREEYAEKVKAFQSALEKMSPQEPDWDALRKRNPAKFAAEWAEWQRLKQHEETIRVEAERVEAERQAEQLEQMRVAVEAERAKLTEAIPEWSDPETAKRDIGALREYAKSSYGYADGELDQVYDHRVLVILRKAMAYDDLTRKAGDVRKRGESSPVLKPGGSKPKGGKKRAVREARERVAQTGRVDDAASAILRMGILGGGK